MRAGLRRRTGTAAAAALVVLGAAACGSSTKNGIITASGIGTPAATSTTTAPVSTTAAPTTTGTGGPATPSTPATTTTAAVMPTTSPSTSGTSATDALVTAQYTKFWTVVDHIASTTSNPHDPALATVATGFALSHLMVGLGTQKNGGTRTYGVSITRVRSVHVQGTTATVIDCHGASNYGLMNLKTGKKLTNGFPMDKTIGTLALTGGTWKVTKVETIAGQHNC